MSDRPIVVYNIPGRVVLNLETETIAQLAEIPTVRAVKQANADLDAGATRSSSSGSTSTRATTTSSSRSSSSAAGAASASTRTSSARRCKELVRRFRAGDVEGARALDEELRPSIDLLRVVVEPDRDQVRAEPPRPRGRGPPASARRGDGRGARRPFAAASSGSGCFSRLPPSAPGGLPQHAHTLRRERAAAPHHPARRPRRGRQEHDRVRDGRRDRSSSTPASRSRATSTSASISCSRTSATSRDGACGPSS